MKLHLRTAYMAAFCGIVSLLASGAQAASNSWFGVWQLKVESSDQTPETLITATPGEAPCGWSVEDKSELVTRFDGEPSADVGAGSNRDWTFAIKVTSATSYVWTFSRSGKPVVQGLDTLGDDLNTFKEVSCADGNPQKTRTVAYETH